MQTRPLATLLLVLFAALPIFAQNKQERKVNTFNKISIRSAIEAHIRQGSSFSVSIETDSKDIDKIITEVVGNELIIKRRENMNWNWNNNSGKVVAYITLPELKGLDVSGASTATGETAFKTEDFHLEASGASHITLEITATQFKAQLSGASRTELTLNATDLRAELSGASRLQLKGRADNQSLDLSGASRYDGYDFPAKKVKMEGSGGSTAEVAVSEEIKADMSGGSSLRYKGNPTRSETNATGGSSVRKSGDMK